MSCGNPFKHAIEDVKETFSKSCGVPMQGNDWCDLVSRMNACSLAAAQWTTKNIELTGGLIMQATRSFRSNGSNTFSSIFLWFSVL